MGLRGQQPRPPPQGVILPNSPLPRATPLSIVMKIICLALVALAALATAAAAAAPALPKAKAELAAIAGTAVSTTTFALGFPDWCARVRTCGRVCLQA